MTPLSLAAGGNGRVRQRVTGLVRRSRPSTPLGGGFSEGGKQPSLVSRDNRLPCSSLIDVEKNPLAPRLRAARLSCVHSASTASRLHVRDDRDTPLSEEAGRAACTREWSRNRNIFLVRTGQGGVALKRRAKFAVWRGSAASLEHRGMTDSCNGLSRQPNFGTMRLPRIRACCGMRAGFRVGRYCLAVCLE